MEKFLVIDIAGHFAGVIEAEDEPHAIQKVEPSDIVLGVDDAMTLAEKLVEFVANYRASVSKKKNPLGKDVQVKSVLEDIFLNLTR